jgi:hypothetical protein
LTISPVVENAKVARYCSKDCQISAWKGGHSKKCEAVRAKTAAFEAMLFQIGEAHKEMDDLHGLPLSLRHEYTVATSSFTFPQHLEAKYPLAGPSMDLFYSNLSQIAKGEWWVYGNPVKSRKKRISSPVLSPAPERALIVTVSQFLMYDVKSYAEKWNIDLTRISEKTLGSSLFCSALGDTTDLTASNFLRIYERVASEENNDLAHTKHWRSISVEEFRRAAHKIL